MFSREYNKIILKILNKKKCVTIFEICHTCLFGCKNFVPKNELLNGDLEGLKSLFED